VSDWPAPVGEPALHGPAGEFVRRTAPHTESDPIALLVQFLVCFGAAARRGVQYPSRRPATTSTSSRSSSGPQRRQRHDGNDRPAELWVPLPNAA
jgi:hypothetical protein